MRAYSSSKRRAVLALLLIGACALSGRLGVAATKPALESDTVKYVFNPIVVTANKATGTLRDVDASVSVLDASLPRLLGSVSVPEALSQTVPGVYVTQRGVLGFGVGPDAAGGITLRGIGGSPNTQVLMLVDGRPDFMGMMGHPLPDAYDLESADRIEVVRGPSSVLYGSNAMGGVINIIPHRVRHPGMETRAKLRQGRFDTRVYSLQHGGNFRTWDYALTGVYKHTDGHRPGSQFDAQNYSAHFGFKAGSVAEWSINANVAKYKSYDPGPVSAPTTDHWVDVLRQGLEIQLKGKTVAGEGTVKLHGNFGRHDIYDGWHSTDRTLGIIAYLNLKPLSGNLTTVGLDAMRYGGRGENRILNRDFGEHFITQWAPYVHLRQILARQLILSLGLRVEHHQLFGYEAVPKIGLVVEPVQSLTIRLTSGKGFRSPTIRELYLFPAPTPTLEPERLWNNEIGAQLQLSERFFADITAFRATGSNLIRVEGRYPNLKLRNSGEFVHKGVEWNLAWHPTPATTVRFFGSSLDPDEQTRYAPKRRYGLNLIGVRGPVQASVNISRFEQIYGEDFHRLPLPDYTLVDLGVIFSVGRFTYITLQVQNALDADYQVMFEYPMPGRMVSVGVGAAL